MENNILGFSEATSLFSVPVLNVETEDGKWIQVKSKDNFKTGDIEIEISADKMHYIDLANSEINVKFEIIKEDTGTKITDFETAKLGLVNNVLHSLFQQIDVKFNGTLLETNESLYMYKAYIENLLNFNKESKDTFLKLEGFIKDDVMDGWYDVDNEVLVWSDENKTIKKMKDGSTTEQEKTSVKKNASIKKRMDLSNNGIFHFVGPLHLDCFRTRYILPNVKIGLKFSRNKDDFCLMYKGNENQYVIHITNIYLNVRKVKLSNSVMLEHISRLESGLNAKYPIKQIKMIQKNIENAQSLSITNLHSGTMPKRFIFGFVRTKAFAGNNELNPFNFENINIHNVKVNNGGLGNLAYEEGILTKYESNQYQSAYNLLFSNLRYAPSDITYEEFKNGNTLYVFDFSPDLNTSEYYSLTKDGTLNLEIIFENEKVPTKKYTLIGFLEFDNIFEIDKLRNIRYNKNI